MKNKVNVALLLVFLLSGCAMPAYLPTSDEIDTNPHGSQIKVKLQDKQSVKGELIAINEDIIVVLVKSGIQKECMVYPVSSIESFTLRYARGRNYAWSMLLFPLSSIVHGYYSLLTAPINLLVTTVVTISGNNAFRYKEYEIDVQDLQMFARFPQGIPFDVELDEIQ